MGEQNFLKSKMNELYGLRNRFFCKGSHKTVTHTHKHTHTHTHTHAHAILSRNIQGSCLILADKATTMAALTQLSALLATLPPGNE